MTCNLVSVLLSCFEMGESIIKVLIVPDIALYIILQAYSYSA